MPRVNYIVNIEVCDYNNQMFVFYNWYDDNDDNEIKVNQLTK